PSRVLESACRRSRVVEQAHGDLGASAGGARRRTESVDVVRRDEAATAEFPTGTLTFCFTDLERSTGLWEEHPEAMKRALARHDRILRDGVEGHGGHVVKTTGDGVHAVFGSAHEALEACLDAQSALAGEP